MKKIILVFIMTTSIFGCVSLRNKPGAVVEEYYNALSAGDYDRGYSMVCKEDQVRLNKKVLGSRRFSEIARLEKSELFAKFLSLRKYEILEVEIHNSRAYVEVKIMEPALSSNVLQELLPKGGKERLKELQTKKGLPMTTRTETIRMIKEEAGWRIILPYVLPEGHY